MNVTLLRAPDLPVLFLAAIGRLVHAEATPLSHAQRIALTQQILRRSRFPLTDEVIVQLANELTALAEDIGTMEVLLARFDMVERTVRYTAVGVEMALAGQVVGLPLFDTPQERHYNHGASA